MDPEDFLIDDEDSQLEEDSQLAELAQLAGEIFEEDHDGDDYRARRIWL